MSERKKIEERLRRKEQEIVALEEKIKATKVYVQALRDILKMLGASDSRSEAEYESTLRAGSAVDQARRVILAKRNPVHIDDIITALGKEINRDNKASLTSSLAAYVRRGEIFTRPAPNTFGLSELGHEAGDEKDEEPPPNFGQSRALNRSAADDDIPF